MVLEGRKDRQNCSKDSGENKKRELLIYRITPYSQKAKRLGTNVKKGDRHIVQKYKRRLMFRKYTGKKVRRNFSGKEWKIALKGERTNHLPSRVRHRRAFCSS